MADSIDLVDKGHVAGKGGIDDGGLNAGIFHHIQNRGDQIARLPGEGTD